MAPPRAAAAAACRAVARRGRAAAGPLPLGSRAGPCGPRGGAAAGALAALQQPALPRPAACRGAPAGRLGGGSAAARRGLATSAQPGPAGPAAANRAGAVAAASPTTGSGAGGTAARSDATATAGGSSGSGTPPPGGGSRQERVRLWIRKGIRSARVLVLAGGLGTAGYTKGLHDYAADPEGVQREHTVAVLRSSGALDAEGRPKLCSPESEECQMVKRVLPRVLKGAEKTLRLRAEQLKKEQEQQPDNDFSEQLDELALAQKQIRNWRPGGFYVLDVNSPNAFVHAMIPRTIFVHRGIFKLHALRDPSDGLAKGASAAVRDGEAWTLVEVVSVETGAGSVCWSVRTSAGDVCTITDSDNIRAVMTTTVIENDEQLAMLLAHEISHVIHNHHRHSADMLIAGLTFQAVILSLLDPSGMLTLLVELALPSLDRFAWQLPHSRGNETEADATGLQICAMAGYDPRVASTFLRKLGEVEEASRGDDETRSASWTSTHPATSDRVRALAALEDEALNAFHEAGRAGPRRRGFLR